MCRVEIDQWLQMYILTPHDEFVEEVGHFFKTVGDLLAGRHAEHGIEFFKRTSFGLENFCQKRVGERMEFGDAYLRKE